jgi:hypothetical protein
MANDEQDEGSCCVCETLASRAKRVIVDHTAYPDEGEWFCLPECNRAYHEAEGDYEKARELLREGR